MRKTLVRTTKLYSPAIQPALGNLALQAPMPSPATLSRSKLWLDVCMMLRYRDMHRAYLEERKVTMYVLCDASQIAGRNLMMTEYCCIPGNKLLGAAEAANAMKALPQIEPFSLTHGR